MDILLSRLPDGAVTADPRILWDRAIDSCHSGLQDLLLTG
jgi:hypothetical protein